MKHVMPILLLASLAAAYGFGIAKNHPFVDGNKRAAFAAIVVFLGLNGIDFMVPPESATAMILALAAGAQARGHRWPGGVDLGVHVERGLVRP